MKQMNLFTLSSILVAISSFIMAGFLFFKGRKSETNLIWIFFCLSLTMWGIGGCMFSTTLDPSKSLFWWQFGYSGAILTNVFYVHFIFKFLGIKKEKFIATVYFLTCAFLFLN
ncbi:MAG: hypothetical protein KJ893_05380, partial [Candidatus Omnitrophica bacterium]|nr:hypothetical protein [Candidatus Omnitrophota bacterium]